MASLLSTDWWNPKTQNLVSNGLTDLGYGLANSTNIGNGLGVAAQQQATLQPARDLQAEQIAAKKQQAQQLQTAIANLRDKYKRPDLADAVAQGYDVNKAWQDVLTKKAPLEINGQLIDPTTYKVLGDFRDPKDINPQAAGQNDPSDVATYKFYAQQETAAGRTPKSFADWYAGSKQAAKGSLGQTLPFFDPKTQQWHPIQQFTDGSLVDTLTGQAPDSSLQYDPTGFAQSRASANASGKISGTTEANLPLSDQTVQNALDSIQRARGLNPDGTKNDRLNQGLNDTFGTYGIGPIQIPDQWGFTMPQSAKQDYATILDQLGGQSFLGAYQQLRGAGAITEVEGAKAGEAVARLNRAQSKEAFLQALNDYEEILKAGQTRLHQQAGLARGGGNGGDLSTLSDADLLNALNN